MGDNRAMRDKDEDLLDQVEKALGVEAEPEDQAEADNIRRFQPPNIPG